MKQAHLTGHVSTLNETNGSYNNVMQSLISTHEAANGWERATQILLTLRTPKFEALASFQTIVMKNMGFHRCKEL